MRSFRRSAVTRPTLLLLAAACITPAQAILGAAGEPGDQGKTRTTLLAELEPVAGAFAENPGSPSARLDYTAAIFELGDFWRAREVVAPLLDEPEAALDALELGGRLALMLGDLGQAEVLYLRLLDRSSDDPEARAMAVTGLLRACTQQNRFDRIRELDLPTDNPVGALARAFDANPYRTCWPDDGGPVAVPFVMTDPLPVLTIEVDGVPVTVFVDTGADMLVLDPEIAEALGIKPIADRQGRFAGGHTARLWYGKAGTVRLGPVTMHGVPVAALPTKRFSPDFDGGRHIIGGILGTAILRQFLATLDYENGRLVLREAGESGRSALRRELGGHPVTHVPFVLDRFHVMLARGTLNHRKGLTFFVDSGLNSAACLVAPVQTLDDLGIPVPLLDTTGQGGGQGELLSGSFPIQQVGLGSLSQTDMSGDFGPMPPPLYRSFGYVLDGILSHRFLRRYATWTLDFESRTYTFTESGGG